MDDFLCAVSVVLCYLNENVGEQRDSGDIQSRLIKHQETKKAPTSSEIWVALILEKEGGFRLAPKRGVDPSEDGLWYFYQPGGSQRAIDFELFVVQNGKRLPKTVPLEIKQSESNHIFLNDGWFHDNIVYIILYNLKYDPVCFIGLGPNIRTPEDTKIMEYMIQRRTEENEKLKTFNARYLKALNRFANRWSCSQFDNAEFREDCLNQTIEWLGQET